MKGLGKLNANSKGHSKALKLKYAVRDEIPE